MVVLFALALYLYNSMQPQLGLVLLAVTFAIPMGWMVLAAREADYNDSPLRNFAPRLTIWLVLGAIILGATQWNVDRRITYMWIGFALLYVGCGLAALRILSRRPRRPQLTALAGGNLERRRTRPNPNGGTHGRQAKA